MSGNDACDFCIISLKGNYLTFTSLSFSRTETLYGSGPALTWLLRKTKFEMRRWRGPGLLNGLVRQNLLSVTSWVTKHQTLTLEELNFCLFKATVFWGLCFNNLVLILTETYLHINLTSSLISEKNMVLIFN